MALNDYENKKQYTKFKRHVDDSKERINAESINKIQEGISEQQVETNKIKNRAFEERVYTIFENNLYTNAMFKDTLENGEYLNMTQSSNTYFNTDELNIQLTKNSTSGEIKSTKIYSVHGPQIELNDFFLISNEYLPLGSSINYYLENFKGERFPILQNSLKLPMHLTEALENGFSLVAVLKANGLGETPYINGYAILYHDAQVEKDYGLTNPDLQRFP
jgi:hypothetical protein